MGSKGNWEIGPWKMGILAPTGRYNNNNCELDGKRGLRERGSPGGGGGGAGGGGVVVEEGNSRGERSLIKLSVF